MGVGAPGAAPGAAKNWIFSKIFEILKFFEKNAPQGGAKRRKLIFCQRLGLALARRPF